MSEKVQGSSLDRVKWVAVAVIVAAGIYGNSYFAAEPLLYRVIGLVVLAGVAGWIAAQTKKGGTFFTLCVEARTEIRKVVWPTRQETVQTTVIVVAVVLVVALILWGVDTFFNWLISLVIG